jgi:dihydrofolate reductase
MILSHIVASDQQGVIGSGNRIPWHVPADLQFFKETTMGCPLIMGRKTFESLPGILPGRDHIIVSRNHDFLQSPKMIAMQTKARERNSTIHVVTGISEAIQLAKDILSDRKTDSGQIFVAGGSEIYQQTLNLVDRIYLTQIDLRVDGDAYYRPDFASFELVETRVLSEDPRATLQLWQRRQI